MKILYVNSYQGPDVIAQRVMHLNRAMGGSRKIDLVSRLLQSQGHEVTILSSGIPAERSGRGYPSFETSSVAGNKEHEPYVMYAAGLDIKYLNYFIAILSSLSIIKRASITNKFDAMLIYNIDAFTMSVASYYWYRIKKIPLILEYEDGVSVSGRGENRLCQYVPRVFERWIRKRLSGAICVNKNLSERLSIANTYLLPGVVDDDLCSRAKLRKPPLSGKPPYLAVYSGSLSVGKGSQFIPEIASEFKGIVNFVITGVGPLYADLKDAQKKSGGNVQLLGYVERDELNELLTSADFLLNPHEEEFSGGISPFKLVEYLAAGSIVLTTNIGDSQKDLFEYCEIIKPEIQNVVNVLKCIITHPEKAINRSKRGQEWVISNYSSSEVGKSLNKIVNQAVQPNP